ncbi:MAG: CRISPR-associated helicase Cas3' [Clostridiales bacterium]|jgi:CRISPR-associated endonuclease/helicase Cas3|nr:CRISPR-associated helicase Cas3' [Clostridiales bacterium]
MPDLISFEQCIARPDERDNKYPLIRHLINAKDSIGQWLEIDDQIIRCLAGLSAICHDVCKAHIDWQKYIRHKTGSGRGPSHAPPGAYFFSYAAYKYLLIKGAWEKHKVLWLLMTRDIADHHGQLKRLNDDNWIKGWDWDLMDMVGIEEFIKDHFPELQAVDLSGTALDKWMDELDDLIEQVLDELDIGYDEYSHLKLMRSLQYWRHLTTGLVAADRFDVKNIGTSWLDRKELISIERCLEEFSKSNTKHALSSVRINAQKDVLGQLVENPDNLFYTLEMPTGYGKTISSLKLASWLCFNKGYRKIIYVAPYLSILEQTAKVIWDTIKMEALEHHSLAVLDDEEREESEKGRLQSDQLTMEAWAHSIVCTSFQQFSKAVFPKTAQNALRRAYLRDSIVIIDEPQIFDPTGWNVLLCGLEAMAEQYNLRVIFLSATMPTFEFGLSKAPARLSVKAKSGVERYRIVNCERMDENEIAQFITNKDKSRQAVILNTIEDAFRVYERLDKEKYDVYLLHGLMVPIHKKIEIRKIQERLKKECKKPLLVVSTQILEAGVDVSFECVTRALPILPSVVQAAGRVNRHFEYDEGILYTVPFYREGDKDTRKSVYRNENIRELTDKLLYQKEEWLESETLFLIRQYYKEMFMQNTYEAGKKAIREAYEGNWPALSRYQPFGPDYLKLPLFIPWKMPQDDVKWLPERLVKLQKTVGIYEPEEIYELYNNRTHINNLPLEKKKQFMVLFNHYVLNLPVDLALKVAGKDDYLQNKVPILHMKSAYHQTTGLTRHFTKGFDWII